MVHHDSNAFANKEIAIYMTNGHNIIVAKSLTLTPED